MKIRPLIARAALILGAAVASALVFNGVSPSGIPLVGQWDTARGVVTARGQEGLGDIEREIRSVQEARAIFDDGAAVFVDARPAEAFAEGHISGAVSLPLREFDDRIPEFWERHPPSEQIVVYCSGRRCEDSHRLAKLLEEVGYLNVRIFIDGYPAWVSAGHPVSAAGGGPDAKEKTR
ncbi:MAG: rhodanese-like domain-containing protein [Desulfobacterales bacterium]|jgi:rhodanese-related sulfurtransferase